VTEFKTINTVLRVFNFEEPMTDKEIEDLVRDRENARKNKNWVLSDQIRDRLKARGVSVRDRKI
ncbi:MAG: cysteine--tRNA ligase, partial [Deltaproteobacteria bacterium]|nr:cysteine--tRNA ligase [Deltaproteobacteria bacterium]